MISSVLDFFKDNRRLGDESFSDPFLSARDMFFAGLDESFTLFHYCQGVFIIIISYLIDGTFSLEQSSIILL